MKIKIRYNNEFQKLEVDRDEMWVSLSLGSTEGLTDSEMEKRIQDKFDEMFNRPEYNNWHRHDRHTTGTATPRRLDGKRGFVQASDEESDEPATNTIDLFGDNTDTEHRESQYEYEALCDLLRKRLKADQAELLIQVHINKVPKQEYAAKLGISPSAVSTVLRPPRKISKKYFRHPQVFAFPVAFK